MGKVLKGFTENIKKIPIIHEIEKVKKIIECINLDNILNLSSTDLDQYKNQEDLQPEDQIDFFKTFRLNLNNFISLIDNNFTQLAIYYDNIVSKMLDTTNEHVKIFPTKDITVYNNYLEPLQYTDVAKNVDSIIVFIQASCLAGYKSKPKTIFTDVFNLFKRNLAKDKKEEKIKEKQ